MSDAAQGPEPGGDGAARPLPGGAWWRTTTRADGDLRIDGPPDELATRRRQVLDLPWVWLHQVHGAAVVAVPDAVAVASVVGRDADASVTTVAGIALAVHTADCAPVVLASPEGVIGAAHAGWRGLDAGVLEATVAAMRRAGAGSIVAALGPCVGPECYEFGAEALDPLVARWGSAVRGVTRQGTPALDVPAAVRAVLASVGVDQLDATAAACTACDAGRWYSHRARQEPGRQATLIWRPV